jgi:transcriptional regulator with XRE-family HTH domain
LPEVAAEVDVGERLRELRRFRRATLKTIADRSGLSESFLSQVERGRSSASIASLRRIAEALGVSMADLFGPDGVPGPKVLRRADRPALAFGVLGKKSLLTPKPLHHLEVFVGELQVGGSTGEQPYVHGDSEELVVVLAGSVQLELGGSSSTSRAATASTTEARPRIA